MDYKIPLASVLIVGGAIGLLLPGQRKLHANASPPHVLQVAAQTPRKEPSATDGAGWGQPVTLERNADGHFYADVSVDGQSYHMLVDTGASMVALTGDDAQRMGLNWDPSQLKPIVRGAGGPVEAVQTVIPRMTLGGIEATNVPAVIIPDSSGVSLLGQAFLSKVGKVDIQNNQMLLGS